MRECVCVCVHASVYAHTYSYEGYSSEYPYVFLTTPLTIPLSYFDIG